MQQTVNRLERAPVLCHMPLKLDVTSTLRWKRGRLQPEKKRGDLSQFVVTALTGELEGVRELIEKTYPWRVGIICRAVAVSHDSMSRDYRRKVGISDGLIRLSVGLENVDDLIEDLEQALIV